MKILYYIPVTDVKNIIETTLLNTRHLQEKPLPCWNWMSGRNTELGTENAWNPATQGLYYKWGDLTIIWHSKVSWVRWRIFVDRLSLTAENLQFMVHNCTYTTDKRQ